MLESLFFDKVAGLRAQFSRNTFFYRTPLVAASKYRDSSSTFA